MKKRGFTLIELLGILAIIGLILVIAVPSLTSSIEKSRENKYKNLIKSIILSATNYVETNFDRYPQLEAAGNKVTIELQELVDRGYLKDPIVDPKTKKEIPLTNTVLVTVANDLTLNYEFTGQSNGASNYIKDNIIVWYDSYYRPENNIWVDQSNNGNNGIINGGSFKGAGWQSSSYEDNIQTENNISLGANFTYEICIEDVSRIGQGEINGLISNYSSSGGYVVGLGGTLENPTIQVLAHNALSSKYSVSLTAMPKYISVVVNNGNISIYTDGTLKGTANSSQNLFSVNNRIYIGRLSRNIEMVNARYLSVRIYNRSLTKEEILKNYEVDKLRYGD